MKGSKCLAGSVLMVSVMALAACPVSHIRAPASPTVNFPYLFDQQVLAAANSDSKAAALSLAVTPALPPLTCDSDASNAKAPTVGLAVLPLQIKRWEADLAPLLDEIVVSSVVATRCFKVIGASDLNALLGFERLKDVAGCSDTSCGAEIAGALGVRFLVSATVGRLGDQVVVSLVLLDSVKAEVTSRITRQVDADENRIAAALRVAVSELLAGPLRAGLLNVQ